MREKIIELLKQEDTKKVSIEDLISILNLSTSEEMKEAMKVVNELVNTAILIENKHHEVTLIENTDYIKGQLDLKEKGFGFVIPVDKDNDDVFIPKTQTKDAMNKDVVLVYLTKKRSGFRREGEIRKVLERKYTYILGTLNFKSGLGIITSDDKTINQSIIVKQENLNNAKKFDKVQAKIINYSNKGRIECIITNVLGNKDDDFVDVLSKIIKYNVDPFFPEDVVAEANKFTTITKDDLKGRRDLRGEKIITIDGDDSKDFDDAVIVKKLDNGNYHLGVHIADVSHYVTKDSILDKEAYDRGTSVYLPGRVVPMLPFALSNGICSLVPHEDRLTISCDMEIDSSGKVIKYEIYPSVIKSFERMTYTNVNKVFMGDEEVNEKYSKLIDMFHEMRTLAKALKKQRDTKGSINFETEEAYIILDEHGKTEDIKLRERGISENIIEEFMLKANQVVAEHVHWLNLPFIYRVHEKPTAEKLGRLLKMSAALGYPVKAKTEISNFELQKLLSSVEGTPAEKGVNLLTLRSMQKAIYSELNLGHYGLAFKYYTHFTSPIRRYPDLIVHRLLREYLFKKENTLDQVAYYADRMPEIAKQTSEMERNAVMLEREVSDMKKAEYLSKYINKEFDGIISSVTSFGLYVSLPNTCEGLVHITEIKDDYYIYDENLMTLVGERKKKVYRVGDNVRIKVLKANVSAGEVDFRIVKAR
jgi:ribonuclease R